MFVKMKSLSRSATEGREELDKLVLAPHNTGYLDKIEKNGEITTLAQNPTSVKVNF
jgi:hypothetical protein